MCDCNDVSEREAMRLLSFFTEISLAASLKTWRTPRKDNRNTFDRRRGAERQRHTHANVDAVNNLLDSYVTDDVVTKAVAMFETFERTLKLAAVLFAKSFKDNWL